MPMRNPLKPFDDSGEIAARREFYGQSPHVGALILVGALLGIVAVVAGIGGSRWAYAALFAWLVLTVITAAAEWRAGFRATAMNHMFMACVLAALAVPMVMGWV